MDITPLILIAIGLFFTAFAYVWIRTKAEAPNVSVVLEVAARTAVNYAEQCGGTNGGKLNRAIEYVNNYLAQFGLKIDQAVVIGAIEAEVLKMPPTNRPK